MARSAGRCSRRRSRSSWGRWRSSWRCWSRAKERRHSRIWRGAPWWAWAGGFLGAFYVTASIILTPRLGAATTVGFIIAGQVVMSVLLDRYGLLNLPVQPITFPKLGSAVLMVVGAVLVLRS